MTDNPYNPQQRPQQQPPQGQPGPGYGGPHGQQPQGNPPPQQPPYGQPGYGRPAYGQGQPQQPGNQGYAGPPQQFQQPYQQQPYGGQQFQQQPYGAPPAAGPSPLPKVLGWLMALFAVVAIACCFGPWASAKVSSNVLPISASMSVNAFNHASCSGPGDACDSDSSSDGGSSSSTSATSATSDEDGSLWEGWVIAAIGAVVIVLGVLRGLGKRALSVPAAVAGAVGGLAVVGLTIYRWSWVHDKAGEAKDQLKASGDMGSIDFHFGSGWGLWLTLVAGVLLLLAGVGGLVKRQ